MDDYLRRLERQAAYGDIAARQQWKAALERAGFPDPDEEAAKAPLTEWEEIQNDFDEIWWHGSTPLKCGLWGGRTGIGRFWDVDFSQSLFKAHHDWGHRWGDPNSKRKTLRTHRDGSRKNYKIKDSHNEEKIEKSPHEQRRKKRFGGKEHRRREWVWVPGTEPWEGWWVVVIDKPRLDE